MNREMRAPTVCLLFGLNLECEGWIKENISADHQKLGSGIAIGHRFLPDILEGLNDSGFQEMIDYWIYD